MKIFISYGHKDAMGFAKYLMNWLKEQGYTPWLDLEGIRIGDLFDFRIEDAITASDLMIAILSSSSLKPDGFCRRELLFALHKEVPILPIRIEFITPPIQIMNLHFEDAFPEWKVIANFLPENILIIKSTRKSIIRDWSTSTSINKWWTKKERINFTPELTRHAKNFVGRDWLFNYINRWLAEKEEPNKILLIIADPGFGKSALSAQLTNYINVRSIHFCMSSNSLSCKPHVWVKEVIFQLAAQFENYRKIIESTIEPKWEEVPVYELFRTLIVDPLNECDKNIEIVDPWIFVIDSLDESIALEGSKIIDLLTEIVHFLPSWIRLIVTSRPDQNLIERLSLPGVKHKFLKPEDPNNIDDLHKYVEKRFRLRKRKIDFDQETRIIKKISEISFGNFQYAEVLIDSISYINIIDENGFNRIKKIPQNLNGLYDRIFRKRFRDKEKYDKYIRPFLCCLVASKEPLTIDILYKACKLNEKDANIGFTEISQFLNKTNTGIRLFHHSLGEWLADLYKNPDFHVSIIDGQKLLAEFCWIEYIKDPLQMNSYCKSFLPIHLAETERWENLLELLISNKIHVLQKWADQGEIDTGIFCLTGLVKYLSEQKREKLHISGLSTQLGKLYKIKGEYNNAELWLHKVKKTTSFLKGRRMKSVSLHELASIFLYSRNFEKSKKYYRQALRLSTFGYPVYNDESAANLIGLATVELEKYNFESSIVLADRAIIKAKKVRDYMHIIAGKRIKGFVLKTIGSYDEAHILLNSTLKECDDFGERRERYRILLLLGWIEHDKYVLGNAHTNGEITCFKEALNWAKNSIDYYFIVESYLSLGWGYLLANDETQSEYYFVEAATRLRQDKHPELKAGIELGLSSINYRKGKIDTARENYLSLIDYCEQNDLRTWNYKTLICLGSIYWYEENYCKAETIWKNALVKADSISQGRYKLAKRVIELSKIDPVKIQQ